MSIDPKILRRMQGEDAYIQSQARGARRVKIERGHNWIVRFLPARMGPDGLWFARIAKHWSNKVPVVCPRHTAEDFGGTLDYDCPVCAIADELNAHGDEAISKFGYKAKATAQFLTYCVVFEKDGVEQPSNEILNPYEFWHYASTYEELKGFYVAGGRGKGTDSVLDYQYGNDFSVNKTAKGMRLDKLDSGSIFSIKDPKWDDHIKKLEAAMKTPKVTIPTMAQLQVYAEKLQELADRGNFGDGEAPTRRRSARYTDDGDEEASARRPARRAAEPEEEAPPRRPARRTEEPEDDLPYDDEPARPAARSTAPSRPAGPVRRPVAEPDVDEETDAPVSRRRPAPSEPEDPGVEEAPLRRSAPAPLRRAASRSVQEAPQEDAEPNDTGSEPEPQERPAARSAPVGRRSLEPTARRAKAQVEAEVGQPQEEAEEDQLPEEVKDPAPPADAADVEDDTPPPVARKGSMSSNVSDRLKKLGKTA